MFNFYWFFNTSQISRFWEFSTWTAPSACSNVVPKRGPDVFQFTEGYEEQRHREHILPAPAPLQSAQLSAFTRPLFDEKIKNTSCENDPSRAQIGITKNQKPWKSLKINENQWFLYVVVKDFWIWGTPFWHVLKRFTNQWRHLTHQKVVPKEGSRSISIPPMVGDNTNFLLDLDRIFDKKNDMFLRAWINSSPLCWWPRTSFTWA